MKLSCILIAAGLVLAPASLAAQNAAAESDSEALRISATAEPACVVSQPVATGGTNAVFSTDGPGGGTIAITQLVDPQTAEPRASAVELALPVICNAAHRVVVESVDGGLQRAGGQRGLKLSRDGFGDMLPYTIEFDWGEVQRSGSSEGAPYVSEQGATRGELRVRVTTEAGGGFLTAGNYSDNLTIRFEPAS